MGSGANYWPQAAPQIHNIICAQEILFRLYSRYGDPKLITGSKQTVKFAERFMKVHVVHFFVVGVVHGIATIVVPQEYAAKVLRLLFELLAAKGSGTIFLSDRVSNAALQYCTLGCVVLGLALGTLRSTTRCRTQHTGPKHVQSDEGPAASGCRRDNFSVLVLHSSRPRDVERGPGGVY